MEIIISALSKVVNWFCYLPILKPLFNLIGEFLHIAPETCCRYVARAFERNFYTAMPVFLPCVLLPVIIIIVLKIFGVLNPGNLPKYNPDKMPKVSNSALKGKNIIFLGSSVTKGFASFGKSFVDMIAVQTGAKCVKVAVSGTTLVDDGPKSYIGRLKALDPKSPCDVFVCQLSTNDATKKKPLGKVAAAGEDFDTKTVCGAIEYIIDYTKKTWDCPVVFYTSPLYASPAYADMVDMLDQIAQKWGVQVIDLWNDKEANEKKNKGYSCMNDKIHPSKKGYAVWTPIFENALAAVIAGDKVPARSTAAIASRDTLKKKKIGKTIIRVIAWVLAVFLLLATFCGIAAYQHVTQMFGFNHPGNGPEYALENVVPNSDSPMQNLTVLGVGSSVMAGTASKGIGPGEYMCALNNDVFIKETAVGTSVTSQDGPTLDGLGTYLPRLMNHKADENVDIVLIQLGTNDTADWVVLGQPTDEVSLDQSDYDEYTFSGAMESMITYSINTWGVKTKVIIYSNSRFNDKDTSKYDEMVNDVIAICTKWQDAGYGVYLIDMWNAEEFNNVPEDLVELYGAGEIHPRQAGYYVWWQPFWQDTLYPIFEAEKNGEFYKQFS